MYNEYIKDIEDINTNLLGMASTDIVQNTALLFVLVFSTFEHLANLNVVTDYNCHAI